VKGKIKQQYSNKTALQIVHNRLLEEFRWLEQDYDAVIGMIEKCASYAKEFDAEIGAKEERDDDGDNNDNIFGVTNSVGRPLRVPIMSII
jgi:hypothetical protein